MISIQELATFLAPVVQEACVLLDLRDGDSLRAYDPAVAACARSAFAAVTSFTQRDWILKQYRELYLGRPGESIPLRNVPVQEVEAVVFYNDTQGPEWTQEGEGVTLAPFTSVPEDEDADVYSDVRWELVVTYTGGLQTASESVELFSALVNQTVANYNKRRLLGTRAMSGTALVTAQSGSIQLDPDSRGLLPEVKTILAPLVFHEYWRPV